MNNLDDWISTKRFCPTGLVEKVKGDVQWESHFLMSFYLLTKRLLRKGFSYFSQSYGKFFASWETMVIFEVFLSQQRVTVFFFKVKLDTWKILVSIQWAPMPRWKLWNGVTNTPKWKDWIRVHLKKVSVLFFERFLKLIRKHLALLVISNRRHFLYNSFLGDKPQVFLGC